MNNKYYDMQYEVTIMDVKDADAIVVNYHDGYRWWTAVVDAGNVGDANKVKVYVKHKENNKYVIDYAFCTHPDKDHKGGFFDLLTDSQVEICIFFIRRPDILMQMILEGCSIMSVNWKELLRLFIITLLIRLEI